MRREEIIAAIEKMCKHPKTDGWCDEFVQVVSQAFEQDQRERDSLNADFQRAFLFLFFLMLPDRRLPKHQRIFLRPTRRSVFIWFGMMVVIVIQVITLTKGARLVGYGDLGRILLFLLFIAEFFSVVWFVSKIQSRQGLSRLGMSKICIKCNCDLDGLESVLGDEVWVGPATCPECGEDYPAVSE